MVEGHSRVRLTPRSPLFAYLHKTNHDSRKVIQYRLCGYARGRNML